MKKIFFYNTLSRKIEEFKPVKKGRVGIYTCGPTVYNYAHLGNLRSYLFGDLLKRTLLYNGYKVKHVMNITDVGHLTGDMDMGEDKMELGAKREGKSAYEIAEFYTKAFQKNLVDLNIIFPNVWAKATENIKEQIALIKILEKKGFTYLTQDGVYFNTALVKDYNKLSHLPLDQLKEGARVEKNPEKKNPTDFALWKFSPVGVKRQMEWKSPWGIGFPGWHVECSAMSFKYLKNNLDIHCGGIDHINVHHTNEIAQSEAATGKKFFNFWMHNAFLNIQGGKKMAKSGDNFLTLEKAVIDNGLDPLAFRLAASQVHYRKPMEYSPESLKQANQALSNLRNQVASLGKKRGKVSKIYQTQFLEAINHDLNLPQALAVIAQVFKSSLKDEDKKATILDFDQVLGFDLTKKTADNESVDNQPESIKLKVKLYQDQELAETTIAEVLEARLEARKRKDWPEADRLRLELAKTGWAIEDTAQGQKIKRIV